MRVLRVYHGGRDPAHRARDVALAAAGVDLTLVIPTEWPGPARIDDASFPIVALPVRRPGDVNRHRHADDAAVASLLHDVRPDVLDLHEEPFAAVTRQWLRAAPSEVPVVTYSAQNIDKRWPPPFAQYERAAFRRVHGMYPCSRQAASVLRGKGYAGLLEVLPLGLDPVLFRPGKQQHDDAEFKLLLVGRLVPEKGVRDAVHALAASAEVRPSRLMVVGEGPERAAAVATAQQLGVGHLLEVLPWRDAAGLADLYRNAHVVLVPSKSTRTWVEQFGRVITEAQACGAIVAGYDSGSIPEVLDGAGPLVAEGDIDALAAVVALLAGDDGRWCEFRNTGLSREGRSWEAVAQRQLEFYRRALTAPTKRPAVVRADRTAAVREFGAPARIAGGGRPFAVPVLREDTRLTRAIAAIVDRVAAVR